MISRILQEVEEASGREKQRILERERHNSLLSTVIQWTYEPHWNYNQRLTEQELAPSGGWKAEPNAWLDLLDVLDKCRSNEVTGLDARNMICAAIENSPPVVQPWMVKVVNRHLNVGVGIKTFNKVWPQLISTFEVQLAQKFSRERLEGVELIAIEPKLDGTRCIAHVDDLGVRLFTRGGKHITNFDDTVGVELRKLAREPSVFDGELMSDDFSALMGQVFRKKDVDVTNVVFNVFDWMPSNEWHRRDCKRDCQETRGHLEDLFTGKQFKYLSLIERRIVMPTAIDAIHRKYVEAKLEGSMIKLLDSKYQWKRHWGVMKLKDLYTDDFVVVGFNEGTGSYIGHLGSFVVEKDGVKVKVERGHMKKSEAKYIWENRSEFRGEVIEVGYQEVTRDGSLRFPKFLRVRRDREED